MRVGHVIQTPFAWALCRVIIVQTHEEEYWAANGSKQNEWSHT